MDSRHTCRSFEFVCCRLSDEAVEAACARLPTTWWRPRLLIVFLLFIYSLIYLLSLCKWRPVLPSLCKRKNRFWQWPELGKLCGQRPMRQRVQLYQQPASLNVNNGSLAGFLLISSKLCRQTPTMAARGVATGSGGSRAKSPGQMIQNKEICAVKRGGGWHISWDESHISVEPGE